MTEQISAAADLSAKADSSPAAGSSPADPDLDSSAEADLESSGEADLVSSAEADIESSGEADLVSSGEADEESEEPSEEDDEGDEDDEEGREAPKRKELSDADLFRQSEVAADYIEGLLDILDADGDIDELVSNGRPVVEVVGAKLQSLVGPRGATLEALQELTRLAIFKQTGEPSRLLLDVGGYREQRRKELGALARNAVEKVRDHGEAVRLEPMSAFERKCVHDVVNASDGVASESEGVEPNRRIVVRPA